MRQVLTLEPFPRPETARALSPNGRVHWAVRKYHVDLVHGTVVIVARAIALPIMRGMVTLQPTFVYPVKRARDDDNLATGVMKAVRDALVRGGWLEADDTEHLRQLPVIVQVERGRRALILDFQVQQ